MNPFFIQPVIPGTEPSLRAINAVLSLPNYSLGYFYTTLALEGPVAREMGPCSLGTSAAGQLCELGLLEAWSWKAPCLLSCSSQMHFSRIFKYVEC